MAVMTWLRKNEVDKELGVARAAHSAPIPSGGGWG